MCVEITTLARKRWTQHGLLPYAPAPTSAEARGKKKHVRFAFVTHVKWRGARLMTSCSCYQP